MTFPRKDDGKGWAWGLKEDKPLYVWERFSSAYEAQAETIFAEIEAMGLSPALEGAGGQDGEFAIGRDDAGEAKIFVHLEDPDVADELSDAIAQSNLRTYLLENT